MLTGSRSGPHCFWMSSSWCLRLVETRCCLAVFLLPLVVRLLLDLVFRCFNLVASACTRSGSGFLFDPAGSRIFDPGVLYYRGSLFTEAAALLYLCSTKCLPLASVIASSVGLLASFSCLVRLVSSVCGFVVFSFFPRACCSPCCLYGAGGSSMSARCYGSTLSQASRTFRPLNVLTLFVD